MSGTLVLLQWATQVEVGGQADVSLTMKAVTVTAPRSLWLKPNGSFLCCLPPVCERELCWSESLKARAEEATATAHSDPSTAEAGADGLQVLDQPGY